MCPDIPSGSCVGGLRAVFLASRLGANAAKDFALYPAGRSSEHRSDLDDRLRQVEAYTNDVPYVPTGQFVVPTAYRKNLDGIIVAPVVFLWNVEKK